MRPFNNIINKVFITRNVLKRKKIFFAEHIFKFFKLKVFANYSQTICVRSIFDRTIFE